MGAPIPLKLEKTETGCIVPVSHKLDAKGYFRKQVTRNGRTFRDYYHRVVYRDHYGEDSIPEGFEVDHLCSNRACCNPRHLRVLSRAEHQYLTARMRGEAKREDARMYWEIHGGNLTGRELADAVGISPEYANKLMKEWRPEGEAPPSITWKRQRQEKARQHWESTGRTIGPKTLADIFVVEQPTGTRWIQKWTAEANLTVA